MAEQLSKLSPHRDLQCYFLMPSAIAAMSEASASGFTVSGKWRQQFDWAVVEWNRDNTFEHPALRYLPDGDLSGLVLAYQEQRVGCIPIESNLYPVVAWNKLRLWAPDANGNETVYYVDLASNATAVGGSYVPASGTMTLVASPGDGNRAGLALLEEHYYYEVQTGDQLSDIAAGIAAAVSAFSQTFEATSTGSSVTITWAPKTTTAYPQLLGANGNRVTVYGFAQDGVPVWAQPSVPFSGGTFPTVYQISIDFSKLVGYTDEDPNSIISVPTTSVRKLRWTWAADMQPGNFKQTEFQVTISDWAVIGTNSAYSVAGPGSRRIEDTDQSVVYIGPWSTEAGNYSGSKIHVSYTPGDTSTITYTETAAHSLYLGTRRYAGGSEFAVSVDGKTPSQSINLLLSGEDVLIRVFLGSFQAGTHVVRIVNSGTVGPGAYFDFLEIAYPSLDLPDFPPQSQLSLATDWDTYHSQSLPAERTAWLIHKLGFFGRVNHYTGALWFYELVRTGTQYSSLTLTLNLISGSDSPTVTFGLAAAVAGVITSISHLVLPDDDSATVAQAIAGLINIGTNLVWASASGNRLTVTARSMGKDGNGVYFALTSSDPNFTVFASSDILSGGVDGAPYDLDTTDPLNTTLIAGAQYWRTDLTATPAINRAARDWHAAYFTALQGYGLDAVAAFSTELGNGDPSAAGGIAQRYPDGTPTVVNTPAVQTNFSPASRAYWTQVYLDIAKLQNQAGLVPYLQSGEVQWWYFPKTGVGMPFYDAYSQSQFLAEYGVPMQTILTNDGDPADYPNEVVFLPGLIASHTAAIRGALQSQFPNCRFEVLYPTDTNSTAFNTLINFAATDWTPQNLDCLKTECFGFTGGRDLVNAGSSISFPATKGFPNTQRSHLVGIGDTWTPWMKEVDISQSQGVESVVLFALDQYCLIGYPPPPFVKVIRAIRQG